MENEQNASGAAQRGRRSTQRYRRGAHNVSLSNPDRLALTQHLARKCQTTRLPVSDPVSTMLGNYYHAPLNVRRITADVHPTATRRGDLDVDPIYLHQPSTRNELQCPLALAPTSSSHAPVLIDNFYLHYGSTLVKLVYY